MVSLFSEINLIDSNFSELNDNEKFNFLMNATNKIANLTGQFIYKCMKKPNTTNPNENANDE